MSDCTAYENCRAKNPRIWHNAECAILRHAFCRNSLSREIGRDRVASCSSNGVVPAAMTRDAVAYEPAAAVRKPRKSKMILSVTPAPPGPASAYIKIKTTTLAAAPAPTRDL